MEQEKFYLILGCFGRNDDGFISCVGCENKILEISTRIEKYNEMMDYFDACRLFDRPMFEYSAITHFIYNMQNRFDQIAVGKRLWTEKQYNLYQKFLHDHRLCGLYIKLQLFHPDSQETKEIEEKSILIKATTKSDKKLPKFNLKLARQRR